MENNENNENVKMTLREFATFINNEILSRGNEWADAPVIVAGNGTFARASESCIQFKDVPLSERQIKTFNPDTREWEYDVIKIEPHKVVVFSAPESETAI